MSTQSDAAKAHIELLLRKEYDTEMGRTWRKECLFHPDRKWRFDYAVPSILCATVLSFSIPLTSLFSQHCVLELDGGTGGQVKKVGTEYFVRLSGHNSPDGLRNWREKNNAAMSAGWRVWHYAPEEIIKAGRKTLPDEPILRRLPWLETYSTSL